LWCRSCHSQRHGLRAPSSRRRLSAFYAALFVCVDIAYNVFEREVLGRADATQMSARGRRRARRRSLAVLAIFATATLVAFVAPRLAFGLICGALVLHLRPELPDSRP
jgi:hypothetical protein